MRQPQLRAAIVVAGLMLPGVPERSPHGIAALTISLSRSTTAGGNAVEGTLTLSSPTPNGGTTVTLSSSSVALAGFASPALGALSVVASLPVTVAVGGTTASFTVRTNGVATLSAVTIRATSTAGSATTTLTLTPATIESVTIAPASVVGGQSATATLKLDGRSPPSGATVLVASSVGAMSVPSSVAVPPDAAKASIPLSTTPIAAAAQASLSVTLNSGQPARARLLIQPPVLVSILLSPASVFGGSPTSATVLLNGRAPAGGISVTAASSSASVSVPTTILVPTTSDHAVVGLVTQPVAQPEIVLISASSTAAAGASPSSFTDGTSQTISVGESTLGRASARLSVFPLPSVQSIAVAPPAVFGGDSLVLSITWASGTIPVGLVAQAQLSTNHPEIVAIPISVVLSPPTTFTTGPTISSLTVRTTAPTADESVTIKASVGRQLMSASFLVKKPIPPIASFAIRPTSTSGGNLIAQVTLDPSVSAPVTISLSTDHPEIVHVPATITVAPSTVPKSFTFATSKPSNQTPVNITASVRAQTVTVTVTANP